MANKVKSDKAQKNESPKFKPLNNNVKLPKEVFEAKINEQVMFDTVMMERASRRQGTHSVKSRADVSGTGKKPWKQKGTGRARQGSLRSPQFVGGGRAFGPKTERNYKIKVNKKVRKLAFFSALSLLAKEGSVLINDSIKLDKPKTKELLKQLSGLNLEGRKKIIIVSSDENIYKSSSNIPNVAAIKLNALTVEALLWTDALILTSDDVKKLEGMVK
ncbi:50S ribosomal protein L4 [Mesomycoplasma moatsii]|uniref:50S ribosomal protein L4 n=1 Tax=Mesomycoplasma moatsii TaxID=171287 RepID=UPI00040ED98B